MLLDLDKFYNSNYKDFVHKEALEEALKFVPEAFLKDVETKAILSITFSVDDVGENPIYVTYLDKDNKEHIVKLRPNITEQLTEVLKRYPTKVEMQEALNELKTTITNEYTIFVNSEVETLNNTINNVNNSLTQSIKDTLDEAKSYTDVKHDEALAKIAEGDTNTLNAATEYTDSLKDELNLAIDENKNRLYIANVDGAKNKIEKTGNVTFEVNDGIKAIEVKQNNSDGTPSERVDFSNFAVKGDIPENVVTTDELNTQLENYETKTEAATDHNKLSEVPVGKKQPYISWFPNTDSNYIRMVEDGDDIRFHIQDSGINDERVGYLSAIKPSSFATTERVSAGDNQTLNASKAYTNTQLENYETKSDASIDHNKLSEVPVGKKQPYISWFPDTDSNYIRMVKDNDEIRFHINNSTNNDESIGYLSSRNPANFVTNIDLEPLTSKLSNIATTSNTYSKSEVEAVAQEQNATNSENVPVSLQQKTRAAQEITNNSTLVETKDFYILNLDFSFIPNVLPTSFETSFIENILIDAPEFSGKSFNITFKANEHTITSKGVIGEPLTIKTCIMPIDETIKTVEVAVNDKIIIRKENE